MELKYWKKDIEVFKKIYKVILFPHSQVNS